MRIFNATNSSMDLPWGMQRLSILPKSFSQDIMGTPELVRVITSNYDTSEIAILVSGPFELSMCASVPVSVNYVVQSTDEVYKRFGLDKKEKATTEKKVQEVKEEAAVAKVKEALKEEQEEKVEETPATEEPKAEEEAPKPKKARKPRKKKTTEE